MKHPTLSTYHDDEFGDIQVRRVASARFVRVRVAGDGTLRVSLPKRASLSDVARLIEDSRAEIRGVIQEHSTKQPQWQHGDQIGTTHVLRIETDAAERNVRVTTGSNFIAICHAPHVPHEKVQTAAHTAIKKVLTVQAKAYIPRRLSSLAEEHDFGYDKLRFSNAGTRWGSCSSSGTISINIWLMMVPKHLIDYVLLHELSHTRHLDHSKAFWDTVARVYPAYREARKAMKRYSPRP